MWPHYNLLMLLSNSNIYDSSRCTRIIRTSFKIQAVNTVPISTLRSPRIRLVPPSSASRSIDKRLRSNKRNQRINVVELVAPWGKRQTRNPDPNLKVAVNGVDQFILSSHLQYK